MAVDTTLEWFGDKKKKDINLGTIRALIRASNLVQADAKLLVPVLSGSLRGSIVKAVNSNDLKATVSTNEEYASAVEFGTRYQKAQPYIRPALNDNLDKIRKVFITEESKAIGK